jgi:nucleotide-binding universal stress UspA family protein
MVSNLRKGMRILIAYDGSEPSKHALDKGVSLANLTDSEIVILSVVPRINIPLLPEEGFGMDPIKTQDYQGEMKSYYSEKLKKAAEDITKIYPKLKVETRLLEGRPSSTIVEMAEKEDFDLIVLGSRGLGGISGLILGSTSRRVVESCTVPILVVK